MATILDGASAVAARAAAEDAEDRHQREHGSVAPYPRGSASSPKETAALRLGRPTDTFRHDLHRRPIRRVERGALPVALISIPLGTLFAGFPVALLAKGLAAGDLRPQLLAVLPFFLAGAWMLARGLLQVTARREILIGEDEVTCRERRLLGERSWSAPLSEYRGVRQRRERATLGRDRSPIELFSVDLVHPDRDRTIEVYRSQSQGGWRSAAERAADALGVPLMTRRP